MVYILVLCRFCLGSVWFISWFCVGSVLVLCGLYLGSV